MKLAVLVALAALCSGHSEVEAARFHDKFGSLVAKDHRRSPHHALVEDDDEDEDGGGWWDELVDSMSKAPKAISDGVTAFMKKYGMSIGPIERGDHVDNEYRETKTKCTIGKAKGCSTSVANGLTAQIVEQMNADGHHFSAIDTNYIRCADSSCQPFMQKKAHDSLAAIAKAKDDFITVNSLYRSCAQQYLLQRWKKVAFGGNGDCTYEVVAKPGTSNHEHGLAIDVKSHTYWKAPLEASGEWKWYGPKDRMHFTFNEGSDWRKENVKAFQKLANKHTSAGLTVNGIFDAATQAAMDAAPCDGW